MLMFADYLFSFSFLLLSFISFSIFFFIHSICTHNLHFFYFFLFSFVIKIEIKILKIERLQQSQQHWRSKIASNQRECSARNKALRTERDAIAGHYKALKDRMNKFRDLEHKRLSHLTNTTHWCKNELNNKLKIGKSILSSAQLTQSLETEKEKVLPFDTGVPMTAMLDEERKRFEKKDATEDAGTVRARNEMRELMSACGPSEKVCGADPMTVETEIQASGYREPTEEIAIRMNSDDLENPNMTGIEEWDYLERFNLKFNKALMDKLMIEKRRNELRQENVELQGVLQQFLDGISVNPEVLSKPNPLLVINGRANLNRPPVRRAANPTKVDGNHMVATGRTNTSYY